MDELRFVANFLGFPNRKKSLDQKRAKAYQKNEAIGLHNPIASSGHPEMGSGMTNNLHNRRLSCRTRC